MTQPLNSISIAGFTSIQSLSKLSLKNLNILIGSNGSGKSNFISFFRMLENMARGNLQNFVRTGGGAETFCFSGNLKEDIASELCFGINGYRFTLNSSVDGRMFVAKEQTWVKGGLDWRTYSGGMREEARLFDWKEDEGRSGITGKRLETSLKVANSEA